MTEIKKAHFVMSNIEVSKCPAPDMPEYAFIGRSNVGKSSLINMLANNNKLAHTSSSPGKTRSINHFLINEHWYLVDLPGYGFAKMSKTDRENLEKMTKAYITERKNLMTLFLLIDSRLEPQKNDLDFVVRLGEWGIPFSIAFTKADKASRKEIDHNVQGFKNELLKWWEQLPPIFLTSAEERTGRTEILKYIDQCNKLFVKPNQKPAHWLDNIDQTTETEQ